MPDFVVENQLGIGGAFCHGRCKGIPQPPLVVYGETGLFQSASVFYSPVIQKSLVEVEFDVFPTFIVEIVACDLFIVIDTERPVKVMGINLLQGNDYMLGKSACGNRMNHLGMQHGEIDTG